MYKYRLKRFEPFDTCRCGMISMRILNASLLNENFCSKSCLRQLNLQESTRNSQNLTPFIDPGQQSAPNAVLERQTFESYVLGNT